MPRQDQHVPVNVSNQHSSGVANVAFVDETHCIRNNYNVIVAADTVADDHAANSSNELPEQSSPAQVTVTAAQRAPESDGGSLIPITSPTDAFFMDHYRHVIGPWFDLFDSRCRFSFVVPHLALQNPLLLLAALACAARQHHLTSAHPVDTALAYYEGGLRLLAAALKDFSASSSAAVFASCLLLAHCEMIGSRTRDWHLHLSGTLSLVTTHGWSRCTEGLGQACLW